MRYRIGSLTPGGQAVVVDDEGKQVAAGDLELHCIFDPEVGEEHELRLRVTWSLEAEER